MSNSKPTFPNNTDFCGYTIQYQMTATDNIEVYLINNLQFLYLLKGKKDIVCSNNEIHTATIGKRKYKYFVTSEYIEDLVRLWKDLTEYRGFSLIAGMDKVKEELYKNIIFPILNPKKYERFKVSIPNGILLYGPTGCGKTFIVEKLAEEIDYNFMKVDHSDIASPYIHDSVIKISKLFDKAKANAPCLLFFDEIESLMPDRSSSGDNAQYKRDETNEFLIQLNNVGKNGILVVGATNNIKLMDPAILRSGRFDEKIYVSAPDENARIALFKLVLHDRPIEEFIDYEKLATATKGYSCADIVHIVDESSRYAVMNNKDYLSTDIILSIIKDIPSSIPTEVDSNPIGFLR